LIFGGEDLSTTKDIDNTYYMNVEDFNLEAGPNLPEKILPENPGYTLNSFAHFYFLGNISTIFRFSK
jgi:hypothetical protein